MRLNICELLGEMRGEIPWIITNTNLLPLREAVSGVW